MLASYHSQSLSYNAHDSSIALIALKHEKLTEDSSTQLAECKYTFCSCSVQHQSTEISRHVTFVKDHGVNGYG